MTLTPFYATTVVLSMSACQLKTLEWPFIRCMLCI